jgi:hypothetical protein
MKQKQCKIKNCKERASCYIWDNEKKKNLIVCNKHFKEIRDKNKGKVLRKGRWLINYEEYLIKLQPKPSISKIKAYY